MLLLGHLVLAVLLASNQADPCRGMCHLVGSEYVYVYFTEVPVQRVVQVP